MAAPLTRFTQDLNSPSPACLPRASSSSQGPGPKSNTFEKPSAVVPRTKRTKVSSAGIMQMLLDPFSLTWVVVDVQA